MAPPKRKPGFDRNSETFKDAQSVMREGHNPAPKAPHTPAIPAPADPPSPAAPPAMSGVPPAAAPSSAAPVAHGMSQPFIKHTTCPKCGHTAPA